MKEVVEKNDIKLCDSNNEINFIINDSYIKEEDLSKSSKCLNHNKKEFISYCKDCKVDLCK